MKRFTAITIALVVITASARADTIILKGKKALTRVTVVSENALEVGYTAGAAKRRRTVASIEVLGIIREKQPRDFRKGVEFFNLGDYVNAITRLSASLSSDTKDYEWLTEYGNIYLGRACLAAGKYSEGVQAFEKVIKAKADSRWLGPASLGLARCHAAKGRIGPAATALKSLKATVKSRKIPGSWGYDADLLLGECYITVKKYDDAVNTLRDLATTVNSRAGKDPLAAATWVRAKRLQGQADLEAGNPQKAELIFKELKSRAGRGDAEAQAASRTGLAALTLTKDATDSEALVKAAHDLARVNVENFGVVSELPRTCYLLGLVHLKLAGTLANAKPLARAYFEETRRRFPESREALLARDELKKM